MLCRVHTILCAKSIELPARGFTKKSRLTKAVSLGHESRCHGPRGIHYPFLQIYGIVHEMQFTATRSGVRADFQKNARTWYRLWQRGMVNMREVDQ